MTRRIPLILLLSLLLGCTTQRAVPSNQTATEPPASNAALPDRFPGFRVDVTLSDKAKRKLREGNETVIVAAYFTGAPTAEARRSHNYEMGEVGLGEMRVEVVPGATARFGRVTLDGERLRQTDQKDPQLLINVVSGRKSSYDNLLECDLYEASLEAVQLKSIPIRCSLIVENMPTSYIQQNQLMQ